MEDLINFLHQQFPHSEGILVGCKIDHTTSYECCEYDIILVEDGPSFDSKKNHQLIKFNSKKLEVRYFNYEQFSANKNNNFLNFEMLNKNTGLRAKMNDIFTKRKNYNIKNLPIEIRKRAISNALKYNNVFKLLEREDVDTNLILFNLKMLNIDIIELFIKYSLIENPRPSHLKYQIKYLKQHDFKIKEQVDVLLDYLHIERANISSITRSEKALFFLLGNNHPQIKLLLEKLDYLKTKSKYVDAYLLIHSIIKNQNFDTMYIKNYNKILNYVIDTQNEDKNKLFKECKMLFEINKSFIKNFY
jgi:hypothetical protein